MPRRWILGALVAFLLLAGAGAALRLLGAGRPKSAVVTTSVVTRAFAARGITLQADTFGLPPDSKAHALGILSNRPTASRLGVVVVIVLKSVAEAAVLGSRRINPKLRNVCGGTTANDYRVWQSRNVVATLSSCDYLDRAALEASAPAFAAVAGVMRDIAG